MVINSVRSLLRKCALDTLGLFSRPSCYIHILNGHMVDWHHDNDEDGGRFDNMLAELKKYCDFVNIEDAIRMIVKGEKVSKPTIAFTFDDGWRDCYTQIAPQLDKYGVNAMFFINPNFIDAGERGDATYIKHFTEDITKSPGKHPMTWAQIADLQSRGYMIGAHTLDHYCINDDNVQELRHQICDCRVAIEEKLNIPCECFAFPYGRLEHANPKSIDIACQNYRFVFSQCDHKHFFSYGGRVINRRHFESFWPISHVFYFISCKRS